MTKILKIRKPRRQKMVLRSADYGGELADKWQARSVEISDLDGNRVEIEFENLHAVRNLIGICEHYIRHQEAKARRDRAKRAAETRRRKRLALVS